MHENNFDRSLTHTLHEIGGTLSPSDALQSTITGKIERGTVMKQKFGVKRFVATTAALALVIVGGAYAAGRATGFIGHGMSNERMSYSESIALAQDHFENPTLPETLAPDFTFDYGYHMNTTAVDDAGNTVDAFVELSANYTNGTQNVGMTLSPSLGIDTEHWTNSTTINGTPVYYSTVDHLMVPADYEPTAEELAQQEAGTLNIGYGADRIERSTGEHVIFEKEGISYSLYASNQNLGQEAMNAIAASILS